MFCGSGHRGDEHVGQGAATHLGGNGLPASKVRSDLRTSPDTFRFTTLGSPDVTPEPAPSALKEQQGFGRSILHGAGVILLYFHKGPALSVSI